LTLAQQRDMRVVRRVLSSSVVVVLVVAVHQPHLPPLCNTPGMSNPFASPASAFVVITMQFRVLKAFVKMCFMKL